MHTNVHCTELKTVFLIETVCKIICLENFQCTVLLIETKRKICNSTFNRTVCLIESTEYVYMKIFMLPSKQVNNKHPIPFNPGESCFLLWLEGLFHAWKTSKQSNTLSGDVMQ